MAKKRRTELDMDRDFLAEKPKEPATPPKEEKPPEPPKPAAEKRPKRKINKVKLLIVVASGTAATTLTVALAWLAVSFLGSIAERRQAANPPAPAPTAAPAPFIAPVYALHPFFITLKRKGSAESDLVKIQFALEMASPETQRDMDRNITLVRENVYFMLQNKAKSDFMGREKLDKLAIDVAIAVNRSLQSGGVTRVWITDILIN